VRSGRRIGYYYESEGNSPLGRPRVRLDLVDIGWGGVDWIGLAQDRYSWKALVNAVMNLGVPQQLGTTEWLHNLWPLKRYSAPQS
jgi:hypothetical protein